MRHSILERSLSQFGEGGSAEIRHEEEKIAYGGKLQSVVIKRNMLTLTFSWLKKSSIPAFDWIDESALEYKVNINGSDIFRIDRIDSGARICLYVPKGKKVIIFFPKDINRLPAYKRPLCTKE